MLFKHHHCDCVLLSKRCGSASAQHTPLVLPGAKLSPRLPCCALDTHRGPRLHTPTCDTHRHPDTAAARRDPSRMAHCEVEPRAPGWRAGTGWRRVRVMGVTRVQAQARSRRAARVCAPVCRHTGRSRGLGGCRCACPEGQRQQGPARWPRAVAELPEARLAVRSHRPLLLADLWRGDASPGPGPVREAWVLAPLSAPCSVSKPQPAPAHTQEDAARAGAAQGPAVWPSAGGAGVHVGAFVELTRGPLGR